MKVSLHASGLAGTLLLFSLPGCTAPAHVDSTPVADSGDSPAPHSGDTDTDTDTDTGDTDTDSQPQEPPIIVMILADDLGDNYLWSMPILLERLAPDCVRFTRAYSTVPLCCPVRSSFLAGGAYPAETGVLSNDYPNGGVGMFHDADTLATRLQGAGFRTAIVGKYLNGYDDRVAPYVPPGWDLFLSPSHLGDSYDSTLVRGSSTPDAASEGTYESTGGEHLTPWLFSQALAFLDAYPDDPRFVLLTPQSPHNYGYPATEDKGTWAGFEARPPAFAEADVSDKPSWIQDIATPSDETVSQWDSENELMLENVQSLDRAVGDLLDGLDSRGLLERTVLVFTGDNGVLHGEHRLSAKGVAYEEAVRVPVLIRSPGVTPREDSRLIAMNLDLPATISDLAGLPPSGWGTSLRSTVEDPNTPDLRDHVYLETYVGNHPIWAGIVTDRWKYVEWGDGDSELYDLDADPNELTSLHAAPPADADISLFSSWTDEHRALGITTLSGQGGTVGVPYTSTLASWGGTEPLVWSIASGGLPPGLTLHADGTIDGTPSTASTHSATIRVTDSVDSPVTGVPAAFAQSLSFTVVASARMVEEPARGEEVVSRIQGAAVPTFLVRAHPGARVQMEASLDDTRDSPKQWSGEFTSGRDGSVTVPFAGLDPSRRWWLRVVIDGVPVQAGAI